MCLHPIRATKQNPSDGGRPKVDPEGDLQIPCGQCHECIMLRARHWGTRAKHEISCHESSCFLTLTYDDEHLPSPLDFKRPFQLFIKKLRKKLKKKLMYMVSHELGGTTFRPHHHCILFGHSYDDLILHKKTKSGENIYLSKTLDSEWQNGYSSVGTANEKTAFYIAKYALKGKKHDVVMSDGSIIQISDLFDCSKRPAIGYNFLLKNYKSIVQSGEPLPRYYQKKLETISPEYLQIYQNNMLTNFRTRTAYELYAKFKINLQKKRK